MLTSSVFLTKSFFFVKTLHPTYHNIYTNIGVNDAALGIGFTLNTAVVAQRDFINYHPIP
jgi:hypothetical protein